MGIRDAPSVIDAGGSDGNGEPEADPSQALGYCFLQVSRLQFGAFDTLTRYETALWRQAAQLLFLLQSIARARTETKA